MNKIKNRLIFEKEYQDKLKIRYSNGLIPIWKGDHKMIDYCMRTILYLVPICGGKFIIPIEKTNIEKDFVFGESDLGQGPSPEENQKIMDSVRKNLPEYFKNRNLRTWNSIIASIEEILDGVTPYMKPQYYLHYISSPADSPIYGFCLYNELRGEKVVTGETFDMTTEDLKIVLEGYKMGRAAMEKKIDSYLKKYGTKKLHVSSYWIDR